MTHHWIQKLRFISFFCFQFISHRAVRAALCFQGVVFRNHHHPLTGTADCAHCWQSRDAFPGQMATYTVERWKFQAQNNAARWHADACSWPSGRLGQVHSLFSSLTINPYRVFLNILQWPYLYNDIETEKKEMKSTHIVQIQEWLPGLAFIWAIETSVSPFLDLNIAGATFHSSSIMRH